MTAGRRPLPISSGNDKFDALRDALARDEALRTELERALQVNVDRVNPSDRGNRFIVGGTVEWIIAAAAWAAGVLTMPGGHSTDGFDLVDLQAAASGLWSVKSQSSKTPAEFRLTNGLGGAGLGFVKPTVFLSPHLSGLVFVDPSLHRTVAESITRRDDATTISHAVIRDHADAHPECVAVVRVPKNEGRGTEDPFLEYTKTILVPSQFPRLSTMFTDAAPTPRSLADEIRELSRLRDEGVLTDEEFVAAKDRAIRGT